jgi:4-hydroxybenzoate polyprenyltransferase
MGELPIVGERPMIEPVRARERAGWAVVPALIVALRPRQWAKNGLLFVALAFTANVHQIPLLLAALAGFASFCALSSAGYLLNDIADVEADRMHPTKRFRPIAAGLLPVPLARVVAVLLGIGGIAVAIALSPSFAALAIGYVVLTAAYSMTLKHVVLLDVFAIAAGFVIRAAAGAVAIDVPISPWLYTATMLGALLIALGKRRAEILALGERAAEHRQNLSGYTLELIDQMMIIVSSAAVVTYALYTFSAENMPRDHSMMLTIPVVLYGLFRFMLLARQGSAGAPEDLLFKDRPLRITVLLWAGLALAILYLERGT